MKIVIIITNAGKEKATLSTEINFQKTTLNVNPLLTEGKRSNKATPMFKQDPESPD